MFFWRMLRHGGHHVKELIVVGIQRAPDVDQSSAGEHTLEQAPARRAADR